MRPTYTSIKPGNTSTMKKLLTLLLALFIFASCQDEEPSTTEPLSSEEALESIDAAASQATEDLIDLVESEGMSAMLDASDYMQDFMDYDLDVRQDDVKNKLLRIVDFFGTKPAERVVSDEEVTGIFVWNASAEEFDYSGESDHLILKFPTEGSTDNNATFTLYSFEFTETDLPTHVELDLTVDHVLMVELYVSVNWSADELPEDGELYLYMNPFGLSVGFNLTDGPGTTLDVSLSKNDEVIASVGLATDTDLLTTLVNEELPIVSGHIAYRAVKLEGTLDMDAFDQAIENQTDPNDAIDMSLVINDAVVGEIIIVLETDEDGYTDYIPYVEFNDGTLVEVEELVESFLLAMEAELEELDI